MSSFEEKAKKISGKQDVSMDSARRMLAAGALKASLSAVKKNPNLKHIPAVKKKWKGKT